MHRCIDEKNRVVDHLKVERRVNKLNNVCTKKLVLSQYYHSRSGLGPNFHNFTSKILLIRARKGARGKAATKRVTNPY